MRLLNLLTKTISINKHLNTKNAFVTFLHNHKYFRNYSAEQVAIKTKEIDLKINNTSMNKYIKHLEKEYVDLKETKSNNDRLSELRPIMSLLEERNVIVENINNLQEFNEEKYDEMKNLVEEERKLYDEKIAVIDERISEALLSLHKGDLCDSIVLEVSSGVGGQEAMLFAKELFELYCNYAQYKGWEVDLAEYSKADAGGIRHASALINGNSVFKYFNYEAGVHRVQRIPTTEKAGRIHTSTASVIALPQPTDIEINIHPKDLKIETKRASGAGGQHVNTTDSAVRIVHLPTNISVECQVDRSQIKNKKLALARLRALLYQKELDAQLAESDAARKSQVRSNFRNEKIRTYNFPQDRITDHRLQGIHYHNLKGFMQGGEHLDDLINKLDYHFKVENLLKVVNSLGSS